MAMTRKHFEMIARHINNQISTLDQTPWSDEQKFAAKTALQNLGHDMVVDLRRENANFDSGRFLRAAGVI